MRKISSIVLVSLAFLMVGCGEIFAPVPGGFMKLTTKVLDEKDAPMSNVRVVCGSIISVDSTLYGGDTLYTNAQGVVEFPMICLTLGDYVNRVIVDDVKGVYAKDSATVTFYKSDFKPCKQYSLGVAEKEKTFKLTKKK